MRSALLGIVLVCILALESWGQALDLTPTNPFQRRARTQITQVIPASGPPGTPVTIRGWSLDMAPMRLYFGNVSANYTRISATELRTVVPAGAQTGRIALYVYGNPHSSPYSFYGSFMNFQYQYWYLAASSPLPFTVTAAVQPPSLTAQTTSDTDLLLHWIFDLANAQAEYFEVVEVVQGQDMSLANRIPRNRRTWVHRNLAPSSSHSYKIRALTAAGTPLTPFSGVASANTVAQLPVSGLAENDAIRFGHGFPVSLDVDRTQLSAIAVGAVQLATQARGSASPVRTGTVTENANGTWQYAQAPNDRMIVQFQNGFRVELTITYIAGNLQGAAAQFINADHLLEFRALRVNEFDLWLASSRGNGFAFQSAAGHEILNGARYAVDLRSDGTYTFQSDSSGTHLIHNATTTGSVASRGFSYTANETWYFELVANGGQDATNAVRTVNSAMNLRGTQYAWVNARTQKTHRNGRPSEIDRDWRASGQLLRSGAAFGNVGIDLTGVIRDTSGRAVAGFMTFYVQVPGGVRLELERILVQ